MKFNMYEYTHYRDFIEHGEEFYLWIIDELDIDERTNDFINPCFNDEHEFNRYVTVFSSFYEDYFKKYLEEKNIKSENDKMNTSLWEINKLLNEALVKLDRKNDDINNEQDLLKILKEATGGNHGKL